MILEKMIALVTGGSRGIGRAICLKLAAMGATVGINYVANPAAAEETLRQVEAVGGKGFTVRFDVADAQAVQEQIKEIIATHGQIDILVNNAGITRDGLMARMKEDDWDSVLDTNLKGAFLCSKAVMRAMMKKRWGRIINVSSVVGFVGNSGQVNYGAAKAGLAGLTKSMARELAGRNITVNCVAPGYIVTDMTDGLTEDVQEALKAQIPMGTLGTPEDVAASVGFLASPDSNYITGQTLHVNGGMYMGH
ncbi:3-oxoacyl-(acyl-carrier-protein) reductase [Desulfobulbus propionicus DSM 2032]|jgi:3-oxoacyl-[acyl-carrier protein] reductase|uniref:3-oxoacyl-[acyl-carrier-protein] reductase n=1 Tax=Desulfobulbus propionicus (strain ATCC 33891 / DSM 2032 / VKM B-1956 / 1pr3) TaxID=577650 RepID=A0A7U4DPK0_DESPD|nr:3-oxoacyl-ACP reductase FabG [Desulfobulbus propionicus]ADW18159.1 3-oxoacyl-(acyl-carrier-protein) reductase [Desulfobulbus propionicus DSM 2032]